MDKPQPALTFMDLPESARRSIYALAGLSRPCPIDLLARDPRSDSRPTGTGSCSPCWQLKRLDGYWGTSAQGAPMCACPRLPLALLRVSRRVGDEALDVLLRANRFVLRARAGRPEMLAPLADRIPEAHLTRLTSLVVRLNCWPCPWGHDETRTSPRRSPDHCCLCSAHTSEADPALSSSCSAGLDMLDAWELVCARLGGSGLRPRQLDLTLICDIDLADDGHVASRLLDPLTSHLPKLKSCTLRLGRTSKERDLARMARQTALALVGAVGPSQNTRPFPFDRLPWELKTRILRYTHLGPPGLAGYDPGLEKLDVVNGRVLQRNLRWTLSRDEGKCCERCTGTFLDCCCANTYAAYSPTCTCRTLPSALFYVSRNMRRAAIEVLYRDADLRLRHHNLGAVLDALPPAALPLLRRLSICLSPAQCYYWFGRAPDFAHPEWHLRGIAESEPNWPEDGDGRADRYRPNLRAALARLAAEADPARLDLELDLQAVWAFSHLFDGDFNDDDEDRFRWTYDLCVDVAEMVCAELPGLRGVRFRLATFTEMEKWLAREVLGERFVGSVEPPNRRRRPLSEKCPSYHRMNKRIRGSHYHGI